MTQRFPILFTGANKAMAVLGILPSKCHVTVTDDAVDFRMAWTFSATVPRASIVSATPDTDKVWGWGAHGWNGKWLINGSSSNIVRVEIDPATKAKMAVVPLTVRAIRVSAEDPDALIAALDPSA